MVQRKYKRVISLTYFKIFTLCLLIISCTNNTSRYSSSWGLNGELWRPDGPLAFYGYAGNINKSGHCKKTTVILQVQNDTWLKDIPDITEKLTELVSNVSINEIIIPEGTYKLSKNININRSNLKIRGVGKNKSTIIISNNLLELSSKNSNDPTFAFTGGFFEVSQKQKTSSYKIKVTNGIKIGSTLISVESTAKLKVGSLLRLKTNNSKDVGRYIHNGWEAGEDTFEEFKNIINTIVLIEKIIDARTLEIRSPMSLEIKENWEPYLYQYHPPIYNVEISNLRIHFQKKEKRPHLQEQGYNAFFLKNTVNSKLSGLEIINADNGILLQNSSFNEISDVKFYSTIEGQTSGHHGIWLKENSQSNLIDSFNFLTSFVHDLSVEGLAHNNVFRYGDGRRINFDHHRNAPYNNLFSNINVGNPDRIWKSGGRKSRGPRAARKATFWNIQYDAKQLTLLPNWPGLVYIGFINEHTVTVDNQQIYFENIKNLHPQEIYEAQLTKRANIETFHNILFHCDKNEK